MIQFAEAFSLWFPESSNTSHLEVIAYEGIFDPYVL